MSAIDRFDSSNIVKKIELVYTFDLFIASIQNVFILYCMDLGPHFKVSFTESTLDPLKGEFKNQRTYLK